MRSITLTAMGVLCWIGCDGHEYRYYQRETALLSGVCTSTTCNSTRGDPALCLQYMQSHYDSSIAVGCYEEVHDFYACVTQVGCVDDWEAACPAQAAALATCRGEPDCITSGTTYLIGDDWLAPASCTVLCGHIFVHCDTAYGRNDCYCADTPFLPDPDGGSPVSSSFTTPSCYLEDLLPAIPRACAYR